MAECEIDLEDVEPNPEAEEFVEKEVTEGRVADLEKRFPDDEASRAISASLLEKLLLSEELVRKRVCVIGALILGTLDLESMEIEHEALLPRCVFRNDISFRDAILHRALSFEDSTFRGKAAFHRLISESNVFIDKVKFHQSVDFAGADLGNRLTANGATFYGEANFNGLKVESVFIRGADFRSLVDFGRADIRMDLDAKPLEIAEPKSKTTTEFHFEANFNGIKVGENVFIEEAKFRGKVDFSGASIGYQLAADRAKFMDEKAKVLFNSMRVGRDILFRNGVEFKGPVDFTLMRVVGTASFKGAVFHKAAIFAGAHVGSRFSADGAKFKAEANFNIFRVGDSVLFSQGEGSKGPNVEFEGPADFTMMEVGKTVDILGAVFHNSVTFAGAKIGVQLLANGSKFSNREAGVNFHGIEVGQGAFFRGTTFAGPVDIGSARLEGILFQDLVFEDESSSLHLCLDRTNNLKVLQIIRTRLGVLSAQDMKALTIELVDTTLPEPGKLDIEGMTYERISIWKSGVEDLEFFREFLERSRYSRQPYQQMAQFFRQKEEIGSWRRILKDMQWREWSQKGWSGKFFYLIRYLTIGYDGGPRPWNRPQQVLWWAVGVIIFGFYFAFTPSAIEVAESSKVVVVNGGNRFLYSLSLLLPVVRLPIENAWTVKPTADFAWAWAHIQPIIGWILAAFGVAGLTPWVK